MTKNIAQTPSGVDKRIQPTTFNEFMGLGYRPIPIIPPDAEIFSGSSLAKRKDARGKAPGVRRSDGTWQGFDFVAREADESDMGRWQAIGAGIGLKTGLVPGTNLSVLLIDADTLSEESARIIRDTVKEHFGEVPVRIGRAPKVGYLIACDGEFRYTRVEFGELDDKGRLSDRCEILSNGRQFVAHGIHPITGKPYTWPRPIVHRDALPRFTPAAVLTFLEALRALLPAARPLVQEGAAADVNQASLRGSLEHIRKAVEATPNTSAIFPTREDYIKYGYALKAPLPDNEAEAFALFNAWSDRWTDGENPDGFAEAEWRRMKPPFKIGRDWIYELAEKHGDGSFNPGELWFSPVNDNDPFEALRQQEELNAKRPDPIEWLDPDEWEDEPVPEREWEVEGFIPRNEVTLIYGDGGIGKTLLAQQYAICAAAGLPWLGLPTRRTKVLCFFCEDGKDEIQRRDKAIRRHFGVTKKDTAGRLRIACRRFMDNLLSLWDRNTGEMKRTAVWEQLRRSAVEFGAGVIILDTLADIYAGSEIDRAQVTSFVKSCLGRLSMETGASVIVLGHPSEAGKQSGSGKSGSTAWNNSVRARLYLRFPKGQETGNFRELEGMKSNYGPKGNLLKLRWTSGAFDVVAGQVAPSEGKAMAGVIQIADAAERIIADAMIAHPQIRMNLEGGKLAAHKVLRREEPEAVAGYTDTDLDAACRRMFERGALRYSDGERTPRLVLVADKLSASTGVFD